MKRVEHSLIRDELWAAIDLLYPKHNDGNKPPYCNDNSPNGWGNFGCKRCQCIVDLEDKRRLKIYPRSEK